MLINPDFELLRAVHQEILFHPLAPRILAIMPRNQKGQLERLLLIQPGIAVGRVIGVQILIVQALAAARALGDRVARELEVHAAQEGAVLLVDLERGGELREDVVEGARFDACGGAAGVSGGRRLVCWFASLRCKEGRGGGDGLCLPVHRIALPHDDVAAALDGFDVAAQHRLDLVGSVARDQRDLADVLARIDDVEELD